MTEEAVREAVTAARMAAGISRLPGPKTPADPGVTHRHAARVPPEVEPYSRYEREQLEAKGWAVQRTIRNLEGADRRGRWHITWFEEVRVEAPSGRVYVF